MMVVARVCGLIALCATLISAQAAVVVEVSPVIHVASPFSALLRLPASSALTSRGVDVTASIVDADGRETQLAKQKLKTSAGGEVFLEHELEGLIIGYVAWSSWVFHQV